MQTGHSWRDSERIRILALLLGAFALTLWLWTRVALDAVNNAPLGNTLLLYGALGSLIALGLAVSRWRSGRSRRILGVPSLRQALATHQAGHIVAAYVADPARIRRTALNERCNLHRVAARPVTESALQSEIMVALGGMVAEEIFADDNCVYAADDLAKATTIAADMIGRYGMAGSPVSLQSAVRSQTEFMAWVLDDPRARKDLETLLRDVKQDTIRALLERRHVIVALRDALLQRSRLSPEQIRAIIIAADRRRHDDDKVLVDLRVVSGRSTAEASR